ncbi:MAG: hypothetical protein H7Z43_04460, partial [Clostridia bacterium]|nr:hypothetical protein [Deltaproteobacteria bacterium]
LVGEAAGYAVAITGDGLTLGFLSAEALVDAIARDAPLVAYEHAYRRITRMYYALTALTLGLAKYPSVRRASLTLLARTPRLFEHLLALNSGVPAPSRARTRVREQNA